MIDPARLGVLLGVLRSDSGLPAHAVAPPVQRITGLPPTSRETNLLARAERVERAAHAGSSGHGVDAAIVHSRHAGGSSTRTLHGELLLAHESGAHPDVPTAHKPAVSAAVATAQEFVHPHDAGPAIARPADSVALTLSPTAQLLSAALRAPDPQSMPASNPGALASSLSQLTELSVSGTANAAAESHHADPEQLRPLLPLSPGAMTGGARLASALQQGVEYSGIFYEAHLAQWAQGDRSTDRLGREPQANWPADAGPDTSAPAAPATTIAHERAGAESGTMLRQQLELVGANRFAWTGEIWPGQHGTLAIAEEEQPAADAGPGWAGPRSWSSRLRLQLPLLGDVEVNLVLRGTGLALELQCSDTASARQLAGAAPQLRDALRGRGLVLTQLKVSDDPTR
ncbi:MAG: flagellar hook-length control protein FliK [Betaproteobacteria bacterium]